MLELASARVPDAGFVQSRRAPAAVRRRHVRARLHEPLLRPSRGGRPRPLPRRGSPRRAGAGRRRLGAPRRRAAGRVAGADPQRRLALAGLQALLHARTGSRPSSAAARPLFAGRWFVAVRSGSMTRVVPFLRVADAEASASWYARLGFVDRVAPSLAQPRLPLFIAISNGSRRIFLSEHTGDAHPDSLLYLYVDDVDAVAAEFGASRRARSITTFARSRSRDPDGNRLRIGTPVPE